MGFEIACMHMLVWSYYSTPSLCCYNPNALGRLKARISASPYAVEDIRNKPSPIAQQSMTGIDSNLKQSGMMITA